MRVQGAGSHDAMGRTRLHHEPRLRPPKHALSPPRVTSLSHPPLSRPVRRGVMRRGVGEWGEGGVRREGLRLPRREVISKGLPS